MEIYFGAVCNTRHKDSDYIVTVKSQNNFNDIVANFIDTFFKMNCLADRLFLYEFQKHNIALASYFALCQKMISDFLSLIIYPRSMFYTFVFTFENTHLSVLYCRGWVISLLLV